VGSFEISQDDLRANNTQEDYCLEASPKKLPMTLQIAMMARDGWLLASDTRSYEAPVAVNRAPYLSSSRKIICAPQQHIVYAYSGDNFAQQAGGLLLMRVLKTGHTPDTSSTIEVLLREIAGEVQASINQKMLDSRRLICLFLSTQPGHAVQLWTLDIWSQMSAVPTMRTGHVMAGVPSPAELFPQLFYSQQKTVKELTSLAAHTLLMGARCNPSLVDGLDILISDADGTRFLEEEELQALRSKSDLLFRQTAKNIFAVKPHLNKALHLPK
jgi:hypothetical protein